MRKKLTKEELEFIKINYTEKGAKYCAEKLYINKSTIISAARRLGVRASEDVLKLTRFQEKKSINVDDYIDVKNEKIAYILGLIWTDGHVSFSNNKNKTPIVKHCCIKSDSDVSNSLFENLNWRRFNSDNLQSIGKNTMTTNWISSKSLGEYLISENYRNKDRGTFIYRKFPELKSHFLRGIFDGDGCLTISNSKKKYKQISVYFSSSASQDWNFLSNILDELNVKYKHRIISDKLGESSQICIHDSESIYNLCEFIYRDSENLRLERKFKKYTEFLEYKKLYVRNNKLNRLLNL